MRTGSASKFGIVQDNMAEIAAICAAHDITGSLLQPLAHCFDSCNSGMVWYGRQCFSCLLECLSPLVVWSHLCQYCLAVCGNVWCNPWQCVVCTPTLAAGWPMSLSGPTMPPFLPQPPAVIFLLSGIVLILFYFCIRIELPLVSGW